VDSSCYLLLVDSSKSLFRGVEHNSYLEVFRVHER